MNGGILARLVLGIVRGYKLHNGECECNHLSLCDKISRILCHAIGRWQNYSFIQIRLNGVGWGAHDWIGCVVGRKVVNVSAHMKKKKFFDFGVNARDNSSLLWCEQRRQHLLSNRFIQSNSYGTCIGSFIAGRGRWHYDKLPVKWHVFNHKLTRCKPEHAEKWKIFNCL